jgi:sugar/nucleoside kinase (ribokinase family)
MRYDVAVIGLYILDILGRPVSRIPERGNVDFIEEIRLTVAGTAGGTVVDTAKLGLKSLAVGAVGEDEKADWVLLTLGKHGIDVSAMQRLPGIPTSATILNVRPNGDRPALHVRGASDYFDVPASAYDQVFDAPIIHLGGTGLLKKLDGPASVTLLKEAKRRGRTVTFDLIAAGAETLAIVEPLLPHITSCPRFCLISIISCPRSKKRATCRANRRRKTVRGSISIAAPKLASLRWAVTAPSTRIRTARASRHPPMK